MWIPCTLVLLRPNESVCVKGTRTVAFRFSSDLHLNLFVNVRFFVSINQSKPTDDDNDAKIYTVSLCLTKICQKAVLWCAGPCILIKLQNKAIKIINPTNMGSLEKHFQHLSILCLPKLYSFSVGKFMHSYHNKLLQNHFDEYFIPLSSIHYHSTRLATSRNLFLPRVNSSSGKISPKFIGPKVWSSIPDDIKFSTAFTFKKHLLHDKNSQLWTLATFHLSRASTVYSSIRNCFIFCVYLLFRIFCVQFYAFRHEVHFLFFSVLLCFVLYLID